MPPSPSTLRRSLSLSLGLLLACGGGDSDSGLFDGTPTAGTAGAAGISGSSGQGGASAGQGGSAGAAGKAGASGKGETGAGGATPGGAGGEPGGAGEAGAGGDPGAAGSEPGGAAGSEPGGSGGSEPGGSGGAEPGGSGGADPGGSGGAAGGEPGGAATSFCGDGKRDEGEQCDDGNKDNNDGCRNDCKVDCSAIDKNAKYSEGNRHCYWVRPAQLLSQDGWLAQDKRCGERGGRLATISDAVENEFVRKLHNGDAWIGATDGKANTASGAGAYAWVTGEAFSYTNWAPGEPNAAGFLCGLGNTCYEHCASQQSSGQWNDRSCTDNMDAICEWQPPG